MAGSGNSVTHKTNDVGDVTIGVTIDKVFVPFQTISAAHVAAIVAKAQGTSSSPSSTEEEEG